ncbi:PREDICTED: uncharacterized protein LOC106819398 [Priapulus caudatus]|uniref:Uncharacterized protein LOC106819398 n=1 Tax=Priapulus caudatus TaxID=37621 RepID=A0ABM1F503_PRICU|nr:PREDICTED: uncharacterized protein LOC106819398 [Priapulus caudatus]
MSTEAAAHPYGKLDESGSIGVNHPPSPAGEGRVEVQEQPPPVQSMPRSRGVNYSRAALWLSICQVAGGTLSVLLEVIFLSVDKPLYYYHGATAIGVGIWFAPLFIIAGGLGICASRKNTNECLIIFIMVMSMLSSIGAGVMIIFESIFIVWTSHSLQHYSCRTDYDQPVDPACVTYMRGRLTICALLLIIAVTEFVVAIWSSVLCCKAVCCLGGRSQTPVIIYYAPVPQGVPGQPAILPNTAYPPGTIVYHIPAGQTFPPGTVMPHTGMPMQPHTNQYSAQAQGLQSGPSPPPPYEIVAQPFTHTAPM